MPKQLEESTNEGLADFGARVIHSATLHQHQVAMGKNYSDPIQILANVAQRLEPIIIEDLAREHPTWTYN